MLGALFRRTVFHREFDVAESSLTFLARTVDFEDPTFVGIPVFLMRKFQHSVIYVSEASGITEPAELTGRTIGEFAVYGHDMGVWPKSILGDEFGFEPERHRWLIGETDRWCPCISSPSGTPTRSTSVISAAAKPSA